MHCQNPAYDVLVDIDTEGLLDLLGDTGTAPRRIALFHLDNGANDVRIWTSWPGLGLPLWRKQQGVLSLYEHVMEPQQSRWS